MKSIREDLRVLVVDDMSVSRNVLVQMLEQIGVRDIRTASTAQGALDALHHKLADVVISDLHMPGGTGLDLLRHLRMQRSTRYVRFVMTTGDNDLGWVQEAQKFDLDQFLPKPFDLQRFTRCFYSVT